ncbi:MAG TPA: hypothetical protein VGK19_21315 [Capsulimonadaceae bacterium]|jgi:hypothetical protein
MWDTRSFLEQMLTVFIDVRDRIGNHVMLIPSHMAAAIEGYMMYQSYSDWNSEQEQFIRVRLERELPDSLFEEYDDEIPWLRSYACLTLGALLGKFEAGEITEDGLWLGESMLYSFLSTYWERICPTQTKFITPQAE